jgi:hypothetical protein
MLIKEYLMEGTIKKILIIAFSYVIWTGCSQKNEDVSADIVDYLTAFDFESGDQGWIGGISDFPADQTNRDAMFAVSNDIVPNSLSVETKGLNVTADNVNGDMFYYFKRKISGLDPSSRYRLDFEFLVYTQIQGTSDGELFLKLGATGYEPELEFSGFGTDKNYLTLNIDKGETNDESGADLVNIGSIKEFSGDTPEVISGNSFDFPIEVYSDQKGEMWVIIGVDSEVKSTLTFGMTALTIYYRKQI